MLKRSYPDVKETPDTCQATLRQYPRRPRRPHQLRHWFGTNVLRAADGNLRVAQERLRHASPASTAIYTPVEDKDRTLRVMRLPG
jgi:integrase